MANAADMAANEPVRMMIAGYPGSAKTGSLAALANMGYKIRMLDFDGNSKSLVYYTKPEFRKNIDIVTLEDNLKATPQFITAKGTPTAFADALHTLDHWKYTNADGSETDLGPANSWGCDTVVVLDSLTAMGEAAKRRAMHVQGKTPGNMADNTWGFAMKEQEAFIEMLTSTQNKFNVIVLSHLKMVGPNDIRKGDSDLTQQLKRNLADIVPTRLFPSALGKALPPVIGGHFPILILAETKYVQGRPKRILVTQPREELDLKVPHPDLPAELPVETGLASIFEKLAPPLADCKTEAVA